MAAGQQNLIETLYGELRELLIYHIEEVKSLLWQMFWMFLYSAVLSYAWYLGWTSGLSLDIFRILREVLPVSGATIFIVPIGFFLGLLGLFVIDDYKRLQGLFLFTAGILGITTVTILFNALEGYNWFTVESLTVGLVAFVFGMLYGGLIEELRTDGLNVFDSGFQRFKSLISIIGVWAIAEALIDENLVWTGGAESTVIGGTSIPATFPGEINGLAFNPVVSVVAFLIFSFSLYHLLKLLDEFADHDLEKSVLILGPDRAGKTWFMGGTAYCLMDEAIRGDQTVDPDPNQPLDQVRNAFVEKEFENDLLEPNDAGEYNFFRFQFRQGLIKRQRVTVKTVDYPGEFLQAIETDPDEAWEDFIDKWDYDRVPTFEELREENQNGNIMPAQMPSLLSVLAADADTLGLVLPMDEFAEELDDDELPDYLNQSDLESRRSSRTVPRRTSGGASGNGYFEIYKDLCDNSDFFFLATMSDVFLQTYSMYDGKYPRTSWDDFRNHVWTHVKELNERDQFEPGVSLDMGEYKHIYPVYFEPDHSDPRTQDGELKPKLDWDDDYYSLRGLQYVLKRIGR